MERIAIIGRGNVGRHLKNAFDRAKHCQVDLIDSRLLIGLSADYDILLITVSDKAIEEVAKNIAARLRDFKGIVAHTAGSVPISVFSPLFRNYGVLYPLQTFSRDIPILDYSQIPFFIEASDETVLSSLDNLAGMVSSHIYHYDSKMRKSLHLASVFACNFTNAMFCIAEELLASRGIPFEVLHALIGQTAIKVTQDSPFRCQTGPAVRGDVKVMGEHLSLLREYSPQFIEIYNLLSRYIQNKFDDDSVSK